MRSPRPTSLVMLAVAFATAVGGPAASNSHSIGDIRDERERVRDAEAAALAELELLELEDAHVARIVEEIQAAVDGQVARVQSARQQLDAAEAEVRSRELRATEAQAELVATEAKMRDRAVDAYIGTSRQADPWLDSSDLNRTVVRLALLDFTAGNDRDLLDRLRTLRAERIAHLEAGEEARAQADDFRRRLEDELQELEVRRAVQREIQAELQARIAEWEREAAQRAREAQELTDLIRQRQTEALGFAPGDIGAASVEGFVMPTTGSIGSRFGLRVHPIFGSTRMHAGVDIGGTTGTPIWAAKEGRVIFVGSKGGYGNTVIVQHEGNVATLYAHMSAFESSEGDWVDQGEVIGLVGSTGWSTGPHLHFETRIDGVPKDPELFLPV